LARPSAQAPAAVVAWLTRYTGIAPDTVVSVGDEYIVAVLSRQLVDPAHPGLLRLEIRAEMTDPDTETARLLRSLSATLEINCADHSSHFIDVRTFAGPNLTGAERTSHPSEGWVANPRGSYFEDIDAAVCRNAPRPLMAVNIAATPSSPREPLALRPALSADAPPPSRSRNPEPRPPARANRSGGEAQIAAAASEAKAQAALAELKAARPAWMNGLSTRVKRIERAGVAYYRALVFGFAPPADATAFCRQLTASGRACIVR
jgi:hypothetical protein